MPINTNGISLIGYHGNFIFCEFVECDCNDYDDCLICELRDKGTQFGELVKKKRKRK